LKLEAVRWTIALLDSYSLFFSSGVGFLVNLFKMVVEWRLGVEKNIFRFNFFIQVKTSRRFFARGENKLDDDVTTCRLFDQLSVLFLVVVL